MRHYEIEKDVKELYDGKFPVRVEIETETFCPSLNRSQAAAFLGVSSNTLRSWHSTKRYSLPFTKGEFDFSYLLSDLEEFKIRHPTYKKPKKAKSREFLKLRSELDEIMRVFLKNLAT